MQVSKDVLGKVKCGACNKYLSFFPIYIGLDQLPLCGRCSPILTENNNAYIRDTLFESLASSVKFPCIYHVEGCLEVLFPADIPSHESDCPFRIVSCPLDCMWQGTVSDILQHFEELHPNAILRNGEFEMDCINSYEAYTLVVHEDELFSFKRKFDRSQNTLECSLFCFKVLDPITKYNYKIIIQNGIRSISEEFPAKSALNFQSENVTQISVPEISHKLGDPSIIIGSVKILTINPEEVPEKQVKKPNPEINVEMLSELECPVCFDYITPPIFQCVTGHSICSECKGGVVECPLCKGEIKNTQNFTLEKMAFYLTYPCKYTEYGCDFASKPGKIKEHQKFCIHGPHHCPLREYENCTWKNSAKNIFPHVVDKHHDNLLEIDSISVFIDGSYFTTEDATCYILKFSNAMFKLHYLYKQNTFYWAMQLIGPPEESEQYKFEIDIMDNTNNNQRMFLRKGCAPLNDKAHSFEDVNNYVYINLEQIRSFFSDIFTYRIRIIK